MRRIKVGLLVDSIDDNFSNGIVHGAKLAAQEMNIDLIVFFGGYLTNSSTNLQENYYYQDNMAFSLANSDDLDLLVISIASISKTSNQAKAELLKSFKDIPIVTLNDIFDEFCSVGYDNESGLEEGIEYLINVVGRKHFVMVGGHPEDNGSNHRIAVFNNVLYKHGFEIQEHQIIHAPNFNRKNEETLRKAIDLNPNVDALICGNDELAICAYSVLKERGIEIGKDISVIGFDDIPEASRLVPALASVSAPSSSLGYYGVKDGLERLKTGAITHRRMPTYFLTRTSVDGEHLNESWFVNSINNILHSKHSFEDLWNVVSLYNFNHSNNVLTSKNQDHFKTILKFMVHFDYTQELDQEKSKELYLTLADMVDNWDIESLDIYKALRSMDIVCNGVIAHTQMDNADYITRYHSVYQEFYMILSSRLSTKLSSMKRKEYESNHKTNLVSRKIMVYDDKEECYQRIMEAVQSMGINNAALFLYPEPKEYFDMYHLNLESQILRVGMISDGEVVKDCFESLMASHILKNKDLFKYSSNLAVSSLYVNEKLFGFLLFDNYFQSYCLMEYFSIQIATTMNTLDYFGNLDHISKTDLLTGLYNRRGLKDYAKQFNHKDIYVLFSDLDHLKTINDQYGHDEGDEAIKKCGLILKKALPNNAIISRIGGDEFVAIFQSHHENVIQTMTQAIEDAQKQINTKHKRIADTSLSIGIRHIPSFDLNMIDGVIVSADKLMYAHKVSKRKSRE